MKNLRAGAKKMEDAMTPAARVRREFRLGRPPKPIGENEQPEPLHPVVVWRRANEAVSSFRERMTAAKLKPCHVAAAIVYVEQTDPEQPRLLALEEEGKSLEEMQSAAFEVLGRPDVITLGMIFGQIDEQTKQKAIFPYLFFGLNQRGMAVLKRAAAVEFELGELLKNAN